MKCTGYICGVVIMFASLVSLHAQEQDTVIYVDAVEMDEMANADSLAGGSGKKSGFFKKDYPNPKKALWMSYVLPGSGQAYNKQYWKLPIVYGAYVGLIYAITFNTEQYNRLNDALLLKLAGEEHEFTGTRLDDSRVLRTKRDQYDKNRQLSYIGLVAVYALTGLEAFVSAHLKTFDVNEDIGLQIKPSAQPTLLSSAPVPGIGLKLSFAGSGPSKSPPLFTGR